MGQRITVKGYGRTMIKELTQKKSGASDPMLASLQVPIHNNIILVCKNPGQRASVQSRFMGTVTVIQYAFDHSGCGRGKTAARGSARSLDMTQMGSTLLDKPRYLRSLGPCVPLECGVNVGR